MLDRTAVLPAVTIFAAADTAELAFGSNALSPPQDPTTTAYGGSGTQPGYQGGRFRFSTGATPLTTPVGIQKTVNVDGTPTTIYVPGDIRIYFLLPADGTLSGTPGAWCTDLGRSTTPVGDIGAIIGLDNVSTTQSYHSRLPVETPEFPFCVILVNNSGQALPAGWSLTFMPSTDSEA